MGRGQGSDLSLSGTRRLVARRSMRALWKVPGYCVAFLSATDADSVFTSAMSS
ncbi:hypothetical protein LMG28614_00853 [Paraburkholderia ultramafica]|uniref:Uncharacterized protein n=1 Tax=Paraburkholderia ultramafica TaxID=1544867 RepID=A0A6S7C2G7_9BURK|nr:hypothetical protein LMG28614_00853 [Paraburkholderia ultramafica]